MRLAVTTQLKALSNRFFTPIDSERTFHFLIRFGIREFLFCLIAFPLNHQAPLVAQAMFFKNAAVGIPIRIFPGRGMRGFLQ